MANFFKSILCVKTGEVEVNYWIVIEKWCNRRLCPLIMLLLGRIYISLSPIWGFSQDLPVKYRWRSKKVSLSERGALALCHRINPSWLLHYVHKKVTWVPKQQLLRKKPLNFTRVTYFNWLAKIELRGARDAYLRSVPIYSRTTIFAPITARPFYDVTRLEKYFVSFSAERDCCLQENLQLQ